MKFDIWGLFENVPRITGTCPEDLCTFMIISLWIFLRTRNVLDKSCRENQNTHFFLNKFFSGSRAVYGVMWTKHKCIIAFPLQQWLRERGTVLRYTYYISSLVMEFENWVLCSQKPTVRSATHNLTTVLLQYPLNTVISVPDLSVDLTCLCI
jgi:hypothetical protein